MEKEVLTLDQVRESAVGKNLSEDELNLFHAGWEEERMLPTRHGETHVYIYAPSKGKEKTYPLLINLHGGGFVKGHRDQDVVFCRNLVENAGYVVVDIDYHTAPEYKYPYALEECYDVVKYVVEHKEEFLGDPEVLVLAGHSAGGNLVCGLEFMALEHGDFTPTQLILDYPPVNFVRRPEDCRYAYAPYIRISPERSRRYSEWYIDKKYIREITASPLMASKDELESFPPVLLILAEQDSLTEDAVRFAANLIDAGVEVRAKCVKGSGHGFTVRRKPGFEVAEKLIFEVLEKQKADSGL
ncbi:MAG: alpha/beta hydrolase [Clostridiales bacterium]|nr:alpha/beta hydrolase [Clostridiales bacterium]